MELTDLIRQSIPNFEFARIDRIRKIEIEERVGTLSIICEFTDHDGSNIRIEFENARNVNIVFDGGLMQLGEFFVAPLAETFNPAGGFHIWDELTGLQWKCDNMSLLSIVRR